MIPSMVFNEFIIIDHQTVRYSPRRFTARPIRLDQSFLSEGFLLFLLTCNYITTCDDLMNVVTSRHVLN